MMHGVRFLTSVVKPDLPPTIARHFLYTGSPHDSMSDYIIKRNLPSTHHNAHIDNKPTNKHSLTHQLTHLAKG